MNSQPSRERGHFQCEWPVGGKGYFDLSPRLAERKEKVPAFSATEALTVKKKPCILYEKQSFYLQEGEAVRRIPPQLYHDLLQGISVPLVFCEECQQLLNALLKVKQGESEASTGFSSLMEAVFGFFQSHSVLKACFELHIKRAHLSISF